jgi:hypothetical protein
MRHQFYATTKDKKGHEHSYRLDSSETVPYGHEITDLSVAGRFKFSEIIGDKLTKDLKELFPVRKGNRA